MGIFHQLPIKISQHLDIGKSGCGVCDGEGCNHFWTTRVCGPSSLAMVAVYHVSKKDTNVIKAVKKLLKDPKIISCAKDANWVSEEIDKLNRLINERNSTRLYSVLYNLVGREWLKGGANEARWGKLSEFLVDIIISDGLERGAYIKDIGWHHEGLLNTAREILGLEGNRYDLKDDDINFAFDKLTADLKNGPVIASIYKNLNPKNDGHLVVVYGIEDNTVLYADPDSNKPEEIKRKATIEEFKNGWKKRWITVRPKENLCQKRKI